MSRRWSISLLALLAACPAPSGESKPEPVKAADRAKAPDKPAPPPVAESSAPTETLAEPPPAEPPPAEPPPAAPPAWFSADAFEHAAIIRQDVAGTTVPTGETSSMIVLELPPAVTPEQCIENFKTKLAETVKEPPTQAVMPEGHLSLRGKTDTYAYTVVCGMAKGKPTMFLSYIQ
jgi:hypothetical protein